MEKDNRIKVRNKKTGKERYFHPDDANNPEFMQRHGFVIADPVHELSEATKSEIHARMNQVVEYLENTTAPVVETPKIVIESTEKKKPGRKKAK